MIALDTNILIYAEDADDTDGRRERALALMDALAPIGAVIPLQVLGEFLNVCRSKAILPLDLATIQAYLYAATFTSPRTDLDDFLDAALLASQHRLQYFDAVIVTVARRAGATVLLSEDMRDGLVIDGLTIVNPFDAANETLLAELLDSAR